MMWNNFIEPTRRDTLIYS